jgi:hypothetical protein
LPTDQDNSSSHNLTWSKKFTKSTENCYNIQEGRVIERGSSKSRLISPVRLKNKNHPSLRSTSPQNQSLTSIRTISSCSTPTQQTQQQRFDKTFENYSQTLNWRVLRRDKVDADVVDGDKRDFHCDESSPQIIVDSSRKRDFNRTISGVPYREKRNPLSSTRLSCYKPVPVESFEIKNLKNFKSVDDFLSLDIQSTRETFEMSDQQQISTNDGMSTLQRSKKPGKLKSMSDKTRKLFSKIVSSSNLKGNSNCSSSDVCNDFIIQRPTKQNPAVCRRSLSYGTLPVNEFEAKKIEIEDGDSGILVNESGASSMVETDSSSEDVKTEIENRIQPNQEEEDKESQKYVTTLKM